MVFTTLNMECVEIYKLQNDGSQKILAVCELINGKIICRGNEIFVRNLTEKGIIDYTSESRSKLFPKDGRRFLEQLKFNFTSGYVNASDIKSTSDTNQP